MERLSRMSTETIERPDLLGNDATEQEAEIETWEVDHLGKSVVHIADKEECETVARIIRQIGIEVEVKSE